ncbi:prolipoprotein diacylglyceryl transferase [Aliirhizobium terrae]|uniref:prolipoprotein diacylglyceryl transferase n=1 Tax=Terrirhizobium terrae TaxID=2926709 RepID=UPI002575F184|nr:prolipoprotein diacylglyceryl transferase [Rhizobium sp. CC-CFT758]WJH40395.1 prolipoprotein diacylglyceryl transferase [Rhizobium sp. CC-CFT758]
MYEALHLLAILPFPNIDPVAFSIGPLAIHWYGLAYVAGILLGWFYARKLIERPDLWKGDAAPMTKTHLDDFLVWIAAGIVLGGRTGYVLFYDFARMIESPIRIIEIWNGGMSFHGGLIGATLAMIFFAKKNSIPVWSMFDIVAAVVPIGLLFGRIANFINGELWGRLSTMPWAIVFPTGGLGARHPSQLYEAGLEGIVLLLVLALLIFRFKALRTPGIISGVFVIGYAFSRIFVEFFREPDAQLGYLLGTGWLTMGMVLSLPMVAIGVWAVIRAKTAAARMARV